MLKSQSGILRVMLLLPELGKAHQDRLNGPGDLYPRTIKASLEQLEAAGLVRRWADHDVWTPKKISALTKKGIKVSKKLKEIDSLLTSK